MIIGIDASNIRGGGGVTHLVELLRVAQPHEHGFDRVSVWGGASTLRQLEDRPWLRKVHEPLLDRPLPMRLYWQHVVLGRLARREGCNVLFVPGGSYSGSFRPFVTMSQNMLPFEWSENRRYGVSWSILRHLLLRWSQLATFRRADGLVFLSEYAKTIISPFLNGAIGRTALIPHGVDDRFREEPRSQSPIASYSDGSPFRLLYVSQIAPYKHQWHLVEAVWRLRLAGLPVMLELVGPMDASRERFLKARARYDPQQAWIRYRGAIAFEDLAPVYHQADAFVFASSCENLPNTLLEAMAGGLPIACSDLGPMPEVLGDAGVYFNPEKPLEIADAIQTLLANPILRAQKATAAYQRAQSFTWERCARETFGFIVNVASCFKR